MVIEWAQFLVKITRSYIFVCDKCRSHIVKVVNHLLQARASTYLFSSLGNTLLMLLFVHVCTCVCLWVLVYVYLYVCLCVCLCVFASVHVYYFFSHPASCSVLFHFLPFTPIAGSKHWLSLSSLRSSFRSRGSGGWENVLQECQALFRKLGFCFILLLNISCFLFLCLGHK